MPSLFARIFRNGVEPEQKAKYVPSVEVKHAEKPVASNQQKVLPAKQTVLKDACPQIHINLSGGKIEAYMSCPLKFKFSYIRKSYTPYSPSPTLAFDGLIHKTLSSFYRTCRRTQTYNKETLKNSLELNFNSSSFGSDEVAIEMKSQAEEMLNDYFEQHSKIESSILEIDYFLKTKILNNDYSGKIDRIDKLPNGDIELVDYKSGKMPSGGEDALTSSFATGMLLIAANKIWKDKVKTIRYIFLKEKQDIVVKFENIDQKAVTDNFIDCCNKISKNLFPGIKGYLCCWCEHFKICPEWPVKPNETINESIEDYRKRFRLSYSKMSSYLNCPRAYKYSYVDKIPSLPQPYFDFGTTIHEVFENIYKPNRKDTPTLQELLDTYEQIRPKYRAGFTDPQVEEQYHKDGINMLTTYYNSYIKDKDFKPAALTEAYFEFPCGKNAIIGGFIDRIDQNSDGSYEILDYKTEPTRRTQEDADKDMQLTVYYIAGTKVFGLDIKKLSLLMLEHNEKLETSRSSSDSNNVIDYIDKVAQTIMQETDYLPKKNKYCKSCEHINDCPLKEEILKDNTLSSMQKFSVDFAPEKI